MNTALDRALQEYNRALPAWKPWYRFDELSPADQARVEERAEEITATERHVTLECSPVCFSLY